MDKNEMRALMRKRSESFRDAVAETELIWRNVGALPEFNAASTVLIYMDIPGEVPTAAFMEKWSGSKRFAIPKVVPDGLELREWRPESLVPGFRGILEPGPDAPLVDPSEIGFAVIPGVAFCRVGEKVIRLGRGKGCYDRLLPFLNCPLAGVGFSFRWVDELPSEKWDWPLDFFDIFSK